MSRDFLFYSFSEGGEKKGFKKKSSFQKKKERKRV
jgi:hypothetical protein